MVAPRSDPERVDVLLVDDRPASLLALESALEPLGQNIVCARSGLEALRLLLNRQFAVILLDVHMPEMDGFETAALIRARPRTRHAPIIFVTAYVDEQHVKRGYSLGAVDFIFAPVVPNVLRTKVGAFVDLFVLNAKIERHDQNSWSAPAISTPAAAPTPAAAAQTPMALPRSFGGNALMVTTSVVGMTKAAPAPDSARNAVSASGDEVSIAMADAAANTSRPKTSTRREPTRSAIDPAGSARVPDRHTLQRIRAQAAQCRRSTGSFGRVLRAHPRASSRLN